MSDRCCACDEGVSRELVWGTTDTFVHHYGGNPGTVAPCTAQVETKTAPDAISVSTAALAPGLWCDDFDADLPKVVPGALDALGDTADIELLTYCSPTNGKINCPSAWWTDGGLAAFFALPGFGAITPPGYVGGKEVVSCTFWEAVRDEWCHDSIIRVNWRHNVWKPPSELMMQLMFDLRGWGEPLPDARREEIQEDVRRSLIAAASRLEAIRGAE